MQRIWYNLLILMVMTVCGFTQTNWEKYTGNPVLSGGSPGEWDESGVIGTGTLFDGTTYHMWYSSLDSLTGIGYATSPDGITWTKHAANPVLEPGSEGTWDDASPGGPSVVLVNSTYHMWYANFDGTNALIGYATSSDGATWTKHAANPVLTIGSAGTWDDAGVLNPDVIYRDGTYHMWYTGWDGTNTRIGYATSPDGVNWAKSGGNPVIDAGSIESWAAEGVGNASVVINSTGYHMWYTGNDSLQPGTPWGQFIQGTGYATSPDGIAWTEFEENPVIPAGGTPGEWDEWLTFLPDVIFDGITYRMWYTGFGSSIEFRIGYATSDSGVVAIEDRLEVTPSAFALYQAYPNPFNPATTIHYELPNAASVTLAIYDLKGREVTMLVKGYVQPGHQEVVWNAGNYSSGIYIARLVTPEYTKSIKMVLLK